MSCPIVHWLAPDHWSLLHQPPLDGSDGMSVLMSSERCRSVTDQPTVGANRAEYSETKPLLLRIFVYTG